MVALMMGEGEKKGKFYFGAGNGYVHYLYCVDDFTVV